MRRVLCHAILVLTVLGATTGCDPGPVTVAALAPVETPEAPTLTPEQAAFITAAHADAVALDAFLGHLDGIQRALPPDLVPIRWCEAGRYLGLPYGATNYTARTHGHEGASGGYQIVGSTWRSWSRMVPGAGRWPVAYLAPPFVQDAVATAGRRTSGRGPWTASTGCWRSRV